MREMWGIIMDMKNTKNEELLRAMMLAAKDQALLEAFLEDLLTPRELAALPKRWEIMRRLYGGEHQWSIAGDLKIGIATVTRGSRELKDKEGGFAKVLKKMYSKK
jgi:TrpR family trp operon transcriptional repressor